MRFEEGGGCDGGVRCLIGALLKIVVATWSGLCGFNGGAMGNRNWATPCCGGLLPPPCTSWPLSLSVAFSSFSISFSHTENATVSFQRINQSALHPHEA